MADRAWPTSASTPFIRSRYDPLVKGVDLGRDENYRSNEKTIIYIHVSFFKIIFTKRLYWILSLILLRQQNYIKFPRDYFRIICCDLGEGFPKKKMKRGERIGYDKSVNLIRGTRSWGDWRVLVVGARRVWTELERVHAPRRRERGETRARDAGRVWPSVDMVCLHSATMRRSSVFHGNYRRAWSSMPFVHRLISLSRSTYSRPLPLPTCLRSLERNTNRGGKREKNDLSIQSSFVNNSFNFRLDKNT